MPATYTHELIEENQYLPVRFDLVNIGPATIPAHWHDYVELIYLFSGNMTAIIQAQIYQLCPGELLIVNSKELHMTQTYGSSSYILLQIPSQQMQRFFPDFDHLKFQTMISENTVPNHMEPMVSQLTQMLSIYQEQEDGYQLLFTSHLYMLLYNLYKYYTCQNQVDASRPHQKDFKKITYTMNWVQKNFRQPITLEDAATNLNISKEYFCRLFKKCTGQTFIEYVYAIRTMNLYDDLKKTDTSITLLLEQNGITNYKIFMRTFKKLYGDTPRNVRKQFSK